MSISFATTVGTVTEPKAPDAILSVEPETGAVLRTKGRLFVLCEVVPPLDAGAPIARDVVETINHEYYYDLSAGIEVSLRRAVRQADRRVSQRLRDLRGRLALHLAALVIVNHELYAVRVGAAQVFLVRRARLFLPGDEPGDLADFVHRTTTRRAASMGAEPDLLPSVWRQGVETGDTVILSSSTLVDGLGADELKTAAVTLHPRAAAEHVRNRAIADGIGGGHSALFIEIGRAAAAANRVAPVPEVTRRSDEVLIAEEIRARVDPLVRQVPRATRSLAGAVARVASFGRRILDVGLELMPYRAAALPRSPDVARARARRRRRLSALAASALLVFGAAVSVAAYVDYERDRALGEYAGAFAAVQADIAAARRSLDAAPRGEDSARERLGAASAKLALLAGSPVADPKRLASLGAEVEKLRDRLANVLIDLGAALPRSLVTQLAATVNGVYAADGAAGRLWRLSGDPFTGGPLVAGVVLERGARGVGAPVTVAADGEALVAVDDQRKVWRAEGDTVADVSPQDASRWAALTAVAVYGGNLYVLDAQSGQIWKHEAVGARYGAASAFLAAAIAPGTGRSLAVDGAVWIAESSGAVLQLRRSPLGTTAARVDFAPRWQGGTAKATLLQAVEGQRAIYVLDAEGRTVAQLARDGRETARASLSPDLVPATAFVVIELARGARVVTAHGSKIVVTDLGR